MKRTGQHVTISTAEGTDNGNVTASYRNRRGEWMHRVTLASARVATVHETEIREG